MKKLTQDLKYYSYYLEAYEAVLGGMVGEFELDGEMQYGSTFCRAPSFCSERILPFPYRQGTAAIKSCQARSEAEV